MILILPFITFWNSTYVNHIPVQSRRASILLNAVATWVVPTMHGFSTLHSIRSHPRPQHRCVHVNGHSILMIIVMVTHYLQNPAQKVIPIT